MRFLKTGHRIILTEVARRIGLNKLDRLQSLDIYPENPVEFLLAHFDGDTRSQSTNEEFEHHWFDFGNGENNENLMLWSKNLIAEPVVSPLWKPGLKPCELKLNMENGESWFLSIQRLSMEPRFEEDEDKWTQNIQTSSLQREGWRRILQWICHNFQQQNQISSWIN